LHENIFDCSVISDFILTAIGFPQKEEERYGAVCIYPHLTPLFGGKTGSGEMLSYQLNAQRGSTQAAVAPSHPGQIYVISASTWRVWGDWYYPLLYRISIFLSEQKELNSRKINKVARYFRQRSSDPETGSFFQRRLQGFVTSGSRRCILSQTHHNQH